MTTARPTWKIWAEGAIVPIVLIALWQLIATMGWVNPKILPSPYAVVVKWWEYLMPQEAYDPATMTRLGWIFSGEMLGDAAGSLYRVIVGFVVGTALALPLGLAMGAMPRVLRLMSPLMQVLRPIPPIAYIPLAILWFGLGNAPAIFLIVIGAFFPVLMNTIAGVRRGRRHLPARRTQPRRQSHDDLPARHPAGRDAVHSRRHADRHRHRRSSSSSCRR